RTSKSLQRLITRKRRAAFLFLQLAELTVERLHQLVGGPVERLLDGCTKLAHADRLKPSYPRLEHAPLVRFPNLFVPVLLRETNLDARNPLAMSGERAPYRPLPLTCQLARTFDVVVGIALSLHAGIPHDCDAEVA